MTKREKIKHYIFDLVIWAIVVITGIVSIVLGGRLANSLKYVIGVVTFAVGGIGIARCLVTGDYKKQGNYTMAFGIVLAVLGVFVIFSEISVNVICLVWGAICVISSAFGIQETFRHGIGSFASLGRLLTGFVSILIGIMLLLGLHIEKGRDIIILGVALILFGFSGLTSAWEKIIVADYRLEYLHYAKGNFIMETVGFLTVLNLNRAPYMNTTRRVHYDIDEKLYMNFFRPKKSGERLPVFIYIHGGGWVAGLPETREAFMTKIASQGYFVAGVYYGLAPHYYHPEQIENVYKAIRYLKAHQDELNIDMSEIIVSGESAGAHLSAMVGAINTNKEYASRFDFDTDIGVKVKALVLNCGVYDLGETLTTGFKKIDFYIHSYFGKPFAEVDDEVKETAAPIDFVTPAFPKCFIISGERDKLAVCSEHMMKKLAENGVFYKHYLGRGVFSIHAFAVAQILKISREAMAQINDFLKNLR